MLDLAAKREKYLLEAVDCELIGHLAIDANKRETFLRLAKQLRQMADDIAAEIVKREGKAAA